MKIALISNYQLNQIKHLGTFKYRFNSANN